MTYTNFVLASECSLFQCHLFQSLRSGCGISFKHFYCDFYVAVFDLSASAIICNLRIGFVYFSIY